jgi:hypothetical protein
MTYADEATMCDCGAPTLTWSAFDSHGFCEECCCVFIATRTVTGRRTVDVLSVETYLRELAQDKRCLLGGNC